MRFSDLTPALAAQNTWKTIKTASPGGLDSQTLVEGVQTLSLNAAEGQKTIFNRDELWRTFGPQNLKDLTSFIGRNAKLKANKGISDKNTVQQDLK